MLERIIGVMKLDVNVYEEIEHDHKDGLRQAMIIVVISSLIGAIGATFVAQSIGGLGDVLSQLDGFRNVRMPGLAAETHPVMVFLVTLSAGFVSWVVWAYVTFFIGTKLFDADTTPGEMLRVLGFARAPTVLGLIPYLGPIGGIWSLVCGFIAVRQGLDLDNGKSAITIVLSWVPVVVVNYMLLA